MPKRTYPDNGIGVYCAVQWFYTKITVQGIFTSDREQAQVIKELKLIHSRYGGRRIRVFFFRDGNERKQLIRSVYID